MSKEILFEEIQAAGDKRWRQFFRVTAALFLFFLVVNLLAGRGQVTDRTTALFTGLLLLTLAAVFTSFRLVTQIRKDGIYVRYAPLQPRFIRFPWRDLRQVYLRKCQALPEYNGWGIKTGLSGRSYTAGGDTGIQLELTDGTLVLIGTRLPEQVSGVLEAARH